MSGADCVGFGWLVQMAKLCNVVCQRGMSQASLRVFQFLVLQAVEMLSHLCTESEAESCDAVMWCLGADVL